MLCYVLLCCVVRDTRKARTQGKPCFIIIYVTKYLLLIARLLVLFALLSLVGVAFGCWVF